MILSNSGNSSTNKNYTGKNMSFQYPNDWNLTENGSPIGNITNNMSVYINKGDSEIDIQVLSLNDPNNDTINTESYGSIDDGYNFKGIYKDNTSNTIYKVYGDDGNSPGSVYLFQKGNKTFELLGNSQDLDTMDKIMETIQ